MYSILADGKLLWRIDIEGSELFNPVLETELNTAGSLRFDMPEYHPFYSKLQKLKTTIDVCYGGEIEWRGRVMADDGIDFYNNKSVYCEGALSFFNDSVVRPYEWHGGVSDYFTFLVEQHNNQVESNRRFKVGKCTVTDPNNYIYRANSTYPSTWDEINDKLLGTLGGYLMITFDEHNEMELNYLAESGAVSDQVITFGDNLEDITQYIDATDVYTVIVPLGATYEEEVVVEGGSSSGSSSDGSSDGSSGGDSSGGGSATSQLTKEDVVNALGYTPPEQDTTYSAGSNITLNGTTFSLTSQNVVGALGYTPPTTNTTYSAGSNLTQSGTVFSLTKNNVINALGYTPASSVYADVAFDEWVDNSTAFSQGNIRAVKLGDSSHALCVVGTTSGGVKFSTALGTGFNQVSSLPSGFRPPLNWTGTAVYGSEVVGVIVWADGSVGFWLTQSHNANDTLHFNLVFPVYE